MKITLPIYLLFNVTSIWNIIKISFGYNEQNFSIENNDTLKVYYPKDSYSPSKLPVGGLGFYSSPTDIFLCEHIILQYQFRFDENFDPVYGGKLPGIFISKSNEKKDLFGSSGGIRTTSSSVRLAWRKNYEGEVYVYLPKNQHESYYEIPGFRANGKYGDSLWKKELKFDKVDWNNITLTIKLNTFINHIPQQDGFLNLVLNNQNHTFDKIIFRETNDIMVSAFLFSSFFGGSTEKYATKHDTWIYFKNITLEKIQ